MAIGLSMLFQKLLQYLELPEERESFGDIQDAILKGVRFNGTNLFVLVCAIFVASVGLNVNSTAVIIGAMLISPLMGPIMGVGFGMGTHNFQLIRLSLKNLAFEVLASLCTSTLYFLVTPLNEAHSELFARTSPNIYDVLIAFFGGLAGIVAITSKQKGNALQGAAIATALMPPLCTAGYGLATWQPNFFFGAFYLFIINSVFISLATYVAISVLNFSEVKKADEGVQKRLRQIVAWVSTLTLIPSIYLGYRLADNERMKMKVQQFLDKEVHFEQSYILKSSHNAEQKEINLVIGGVQPDSNKLKTLQSLLPFYNLEGYNLKIQNKLQTRNEEREKSETKKWLNKIQYLEGQLYKSSAFADSVKNGESELKQVGLELKIQYPELGEFYLQRNQIEGRVVVAINLNQKSPWSDEKLQRVKEWLKMRLKAQACEVYVKK